MIMVKKTRSGNTLIREDNDELEYGGNGLELVAQTNDSGLHTYPHRMGGAARSEFGVDNNNE